jgi:large subunit ribosomal protein L20
MPRVKGSVATRARRKKVLKLAKGYFGSKHLLYRTAHEQVMTSLQYAYRDRKQLKRDMRKLWIARINAAARINDISYSKLMYGLKTAGITLNRKMLSEIAISDPKGFSAIVAKAKDATQKAAAARAQAVVDTVKSTAASIKEIVTSAAESAKAEIEKEAVKAKKAQKPVVEAVAEVKAEAAGVSEKPVKAAKSVKAKAEKAVDEAKAEVKAVKKPAAKKEPAAKKPAEKKEADKPAVKKPRAKKAAE